ncbi:MAG: hypothetical protein AAGD01_15190 [Acidobacteriota bacterium]
MIQRVALVLLLVTFFGTSSALGDERAKACTPTYLEVEEVPKLQVASWILEFRVLAIGCRELLEPEWPPKIEDIERELSNALGDIHPVQTLVDINEGSAEVRKKVVQALNHAISKEDVVTDVFLYDPKASEHW